MVNCPEYYIDSDGQELIKETNIYKDEHYYNSNDQLHRLDGPAIKWGQNEYYCWYNNGKKHRMGGPADVAYDSENIYVWYVNDKYVNVYYICG